MRSLFVGLLFITNTCLASLGGAPTNFGATTTGHALAMGAIRPSAGNFTVSVSTLPNGTTVREYAAAGTVFAVSWNGPFLPDLRTLLGPHFETLTAESARHPKAGHSQLRVAHPGVVIESFGHMRAYSGRAWIASLFPAGFSAGDIQ